MTQKSIWLQGFKENQTKNNFSKKQVDVCIIGGGIAGISTAFYLKDSNLNVLLIDKGTIGFGATAYTTAKISYLQELPYQKIDSMHGKDMAHLYYQSQKLAFDEIQKNIKTYGIDCDYQHVKEYIIARTPKEVSKVKKEEQYFKNWKIPYFSTNQLDLPIDMDYGFGVEGAVFHPLKYLYGIKDIIMSKIEIMENVCAKSIHKQNNIYQIETDCGTIEANIIVVCTHYPFFIQPGYIPFKTHVEKSYVIASRVQTPKTISCITTGTPLSSIRYHKDYLIYGSCAHALTNHLDDTKNFNLLKENFHQYFDQAIDFMWFNQDLVPNDGLPLIGETDKNSNLYLATGFHTWGMTNGTIAGIVLADLILRKESIYESIFALKRNWNFTRTIHFLVDGFRYGKIYLQTILIKNHSFYQNHVCVTYKDGKRIGIYVDEQGKKHEVLNTCPHMKCHLIFNEKEKTWDCPCHSSRFDIDGNIIRGPSKDTIPFKKE